MNPLLINDRGFAYSYTAYIYIWQFHITTDILWSRVAISYCYRHVVV